MYKNDKSMFEYTARQWTSTHAIELTNEQKVDKLAELGFDRDSCVDALKRYDYDYTLAANYLCGN